MAQPTIPWADDSQFATRQETRSLPPATGTALRQEIQEHVEKPREKAPPVTRAAAMQRIQAQADPSRDPLEGVSLNKRLYMSLLADTLGQTQSMTEDAGAFLKSAAVALPAAGPDVLGVPIDPLSYAGPAAGDLRRQLEEQGIADVPAKMGLVNPSTGEPFTGNLLREFAGIEDPNTKAAILGEIIGGGGIETALMKSPAVFAKVASAAHAAAPAGFLAWLASKTPVPGQVNTFYGPRSAANYSPRAIDKMNVAKSRLDAGDNPATVLLETGWARDPGGNMNFFASDHNMKINTDLITEKFAERQALLQLDVDEVMEIKFDLDELLVDTHLFDMIPEAKGMPIHIYLMRKADDANGNPQWRTQPGIGAMYIPPQGDDFVNLINGIGRAGKIEVANADNVDALRSTILHEIQHLVQAYEGWTGGANVKMFQKHADAYLTSRAYQRMFREFEERFSDGGYIGEDDLDDFAIDFVIRHYDIDPQDFSRIAPRVVDAKRLILNEAAMAVNRHDQEALDRTRLWLRRDTERTVGDAAIALKLGGETATEKARILEQLNNVEVYDQVLRRYFAQPGEVQSRVNEMMRDMDLQHVQRNLARVGGDWTQLVESADFSRNARAPSKKVSPADVQLFDQGLNPSLISNEDTIAPPRARTQSERGDKPVFDTGQTVERMANRNRGGTDGGSLDTGWDELMSRRTQGTHRAGTLEELFPPLDEADVPLEGVSEKVTDVYVKSLWRSPDGWSHSKHPIEVLENPSRQELERWGAKKFKGQHPEARDLRTMTVNGKQYVWDAQDGLHADILEGMGIDPMSKEGQAIRISSAEEEHIDDVLRLLDDATDEPNASEVIDFTPRRLRKEARTIMDNISELESAIEKDMPMSVTMSKARYVLDNPELRGLMSQDRIDELNTVINKFLDGRGKEVEYYDELIEAQEEALRDILDKIPDLEGDVDDIIEGITELK